MPPQRIVINPPLISKIKKFLNYKDNKSILDEDRFGIFKKRKINLHIHSSQTMYNKTKAAMKKHRKQVSLENRKQKLEQKAKQKTEKRQAQKQAHQEIIEELLQKAQSLGWTDTRKVNITKPKLQSFINSNQPKFAFETQSRQLNNSLDNLRLYQTNSVPDYPILDARYYLQSAKEQVKRKVFDMIRRHKSIKFQVALNIRFEREIDNPDGTESKIIEYSDADGKQSVFHGDMYEMYSPDSQEFNTLYEYSINKVLGIIEEKWVKSNSNWVISEIFYLEFNYFRYRAGAGTSYIPLPDCYKNSKFVIK